MGKNLSGKLSYMPTGLAERVLLPREANKKSQKLSTSKKKGGEPIYSKKHCSSCHHNPAFSRALCEFEPVKNAKIMFQNTLMFQMYCVLSNLL